MKRKTIPVALGCLVALMVVILAVIQFLPDGTSLDNRTQAANLPTVGQTIAGFVVEDVQDFPQAKGTLITFRHEVSGAQLCYIKNNDSNRAFTIGYRTPMMDESDINHVFEHSILASSGKYPSHNLIFDVIGKSYNTFVNAYTFSTFTMYPAASQSEEQLLKIADVYLSCMVDPGVLTEENFFKREALRYMLYDPADPIAMGGTVFTEDSSYMTAIGDNSVNDVMDTLYPGEYAANRIGRAWENYQDLTYHKALELYDRSYHFDNALLLLYGDLDYENFLTFLDSEYLSQYPNTHTDLSTYYDQTTTQSGYKEVLCYSPAYEGDATQGSSVISYAFDLDGQPYETLRQYEMLCNLLNAGDSVFQTNLQAAGFSGANVSLQEDSLKPVLMFTLSNADPEDAQTFRQVVEETLGSIQKDGLDSDLVERTLKINQLSEYLTQESSNAAIETFFANILVQWATTGGTDYFAQCQAALNALEGQEGQTLIRQLASGLLDCSNTALVTTVPQPGLAEKIQADQEAYLAEMKAGMSEEELDQLIQDSQAYDAWNEEDVSNDDFVIPVSDLPDPAPSPEFDQQTVDGATYYTADVGVDGIAYNKLLLDVSGISQEDLHYLDLYLQMVGNLSTSQYEATEVEALKQEYLNGYWVDNYYPGQLAGDNNRPFARVTWINQTGDQQQSLELLLELLQNTQFDDKETLLLRLDSLLDARNPARGDSFNLAQQTADAAWGGSRAYYNYISGPESYEFLLNLRQQLESDPNALADLQAKMKQISDTICQRDHMISMLVTSEEELKPAEDVTRQVLGALPSNPSDPPSYDLPEFPRKTGLITEESLCYTYAEAYTNETEGLSGVLFPFLAVLNDQYVVPEIRYKNLAYSGECSFTDTMEQIYVGSYADPNAAKSAEILLSLADALEEMELTQEDLDSYIVNAYGVVTAPSTEIQRVISAMTDAVRGADLDRQSEWIQQIKTTTVEDQQAAVEMLRTLTDQMVVVTAGNSSILSADADYYDVVYDYRQS